MGLDDGSCVRRRPEHPNHVWSDDITMAMAPDGRPLWLLTVMDKYSREYLAIQVARHLRADDMLQLLTEQFVSHGVPEHLRPDNGPEFTSPAVRGWLARVEVQAIYIEPGSPWENGYIESFIGKLKDELLNGGVFYTLLAATVLIERWRQQYNQFRPHCSLGCQPPLPGTRLVDAA